MDDVALPEPRQAQANERSETPRRRSCVRPGHPVGGVEDTSSPRRPGYCRAVHWPLSDSPDNNSMSTPVAVG
jgi:hypothetical protein